MGPPILRDASLRDAPQDEAEKEPRTNLSPLRPGKSLKTNEAKKIYPRSKKRPDNARALVRRAPPSRGQCAEDQSAVRRQCASQSSLRRPRRLDEWSARGAQPVSQTGARPRKARGRPDRKGRPKGVSQTPWRPPGAPFPFRGEEKGKQAWPAPPDNRAGEALAKCERAAGCLTKWIRGRAQIHPRRHARA